MQNSSEFYVQSQFKKTDWYFISNSTLVFKYVFVEQNIDEVVLYDSQNGQIIKLNNKSAVILSYNQKNVISSRAGNWLSDAKSTQNYGNRS